MGSLEDQLRLAFQVFDQDKSQAISKDEAFACFKAINTFLKKENKDEDFEAFFKEIDVNGDGTIDLKEYIESTVNNPRFQDLAPF